MFDFFGYRKALPRGKSISTKDTFRNFARDYPRSSSQVNSPFMSAKISWETCVWDSEGDLVFQKVITPVVTY